MARARPGPRARRAKRKCGSFGKVVTSATSNKGIASSNKCLTSSNKKLVVTSAPKEYACIFVQIGSIGMSQAQHGRRECGIQFRLFRLFIQMNVCEICTLTGIVWHSILAVIVLAVGHLYAASTVSLQEFPDKTSFCPHEMSLPPFSSKSGSAVSSRRS